MSIQTTVYAHRMGLRPLFQLAVTTFRRHYGLRETDHLARKLKRSFRLRGLAGTLKFCLAILLNPSVRHSASRVSDGSPSDFDLTFGVDTSSWVHVSELDIKDELRDGVVGYQPTPPALLLQAIGILDIWHRDFTFVDLGCGKGLALLVASAFPFRKIVGVELSPVLSAIAQTNIRTYLERGSVCQNVEALLGDAREFRVPEEPLILFMYNPFNGKSMSELVEKLIESRIAHPRNIYVIYVAAVDKHLFRSFKLLHEEFVVIPAGSLAYPAGFASDYSIYKL
jgi:predicted RNA methylase